jgi:hypothetical protein
MDQIMDRRSFMDSNKIYYVGCKDYYITVNGYSVQEAANAFIKHYRVDDGEEIKVYELKNPAVFRMEVVATKVDA